MLVMTRGVLALLLSMAIAPVSRATEDYYVWIDEDGITHYTDRLPQGVDAEHVTTTGTFGERNPTEREKPVDTRPSAITRATSAAEPDELVREQREALEAEITKVNEQSFSRLPMDSSITEAVSSLSASVAEPMVSLPCSRLYQIPISLDRIH